MKIKYSSIVSIFFIFSVFIISCQAGTNGLSEAEKTKVMDLLEEAVVVARNTDLTKNAPVEELTELAKKDEEYIKFFYDYIKNEKDKQDKKGLLILVLGSIQHHDIPNLLIRLLDDEDAVNRAMAVYYIGEYKITRAMLKLKYMSKNDPSEKIRILSKAAYTSIENYNKKKNSDYLKTD